MKLTIDFETRSHVSLRDVGAWMYSIHPSTQIMVLSWLWNGHISTLRMGDDTPKDLLKLILDPDTAIVEAHNSFFEYCIWTNICVKRFGWPNVPFDKWRCSASKAASVSLPRRLGSAGRALKLAVVKDEEEGKWAMMKLSKPRRGGGWYEDEEDWRKMIMYNRNDVAAEEALSDAVPDLSPFELEVWRMSERINIHGFYIDAPGVQKAVNLAGEHVRKLTREFNEITGLDTAGQRAKFMGWLVENGVRVDNTQAKTLDSLLETNVKPQVARAIKIVRSIGRSSIKKYRKLLDFAAPDGRIRGTLLYHGAHTGRWAGSGPQPHNFVREGPKCGMDTAWKDIHNEKLDTIEALHGDPLEFLSKSLRGTICAPPGKTLCVGDYSQIEARMSFWLSGEREALAVFARGEDMYLETASMIYGKRVTKAEEDKRFLGKQATLALCFGGGFIKFLMHCYSLGAPRFTAQQIRELVPQGHRNSLYRWIVTDAWDSIKERIPDADKNTAMELVLAKYVVDKYREKYKRTIVAEWTRLEHAFREALFYPGKWAEATKVRFRMGRHALACKLPSGRLIWYQSPSIASDGSIVYHSFPPGGNWVTEKTYGGKLLENITQASARDVMADAMLRLEKAGHKIVLTVHDEILAESSDLSGFTSIMQSPPKWADGLPVKVESWKGMRYKKA